MQLLYSVNGVVVAVHDSALNVSSSSYGTDVRIIPYDQPLSTLERIGPEPEPPPAVPPDGRPTVMLRPDTRPYAEPPPTPDILKHFSGQVRWETATAGIMISGVPANTDRISQTLVSSLAQYAATIDRNDPIDFTQAGVAYRITAQDAIDMNTQIAALVQQCHTIEAQCLTDLNSGSPTILTYEDVEARFSGLRAKTLRFGKQ
ncbi:DUF4376 domain-containing protein [Bradyrhizobium sp. CCGUVB1N3]|uniref:DUF4376 domain-containing protein n=1 Tax=Bradyrhizobium sp. CCGUVB1N3 TaxID=2949629 RepID=UPI0020B17AD4|nr:DUF4376 domain-containing protein [Bradyrhizobium sp. CCGUVB1N3]MCP3475160.1 DUF4376 domain-containing protein [Bradyrhizobium sp. CCGUVB1N3]